MVEAELLRVRDKPSCADSSGRGAGTPRRLMSGSKFCHRLPQRVFVLPGLGWGAPPGTLLLALLPKQGHREKTHPGRWILQPLGHRAGFSPAGSIV